MRRWGANVATLQRHAPEASQTSHPACADAVSILEPIFIELREFNGWRAERGNVVDGGDGTEIDGACEAII